MATLLKRVKAGLEIRHTVGVMRSAGIITTLERRLGVVCFEV